MNYPHSQYRKHPIKCIKKRLNQEQVRLLEASFNFNNKLDADRKLQLSQELGIPPRQIAIWYQNRRARWKSQSLEVDHKALQMRLESALADNKRLEREVERLREELDKAREILLAFNTPNYSSLPPSISTSCDDVGSSSLLGDSKNQLDKELFACLIGDEGPFGKPNGHDFFAPSIS
ncbi:homeobox-leucine zipper protein ATHB-52-like [Cornus florida]|uniref:homeobox-leucine zipper protein ATHB-52-like n=1 Tax=Cornus florida TaxID=4283 RepID=UPI00289AF721|nr:homeobox-leucine zipper protein ATHB-52-like [Cornus florida]